METTDTDALARAIARDCGMHAWTSKSWGPDGLSRTYIQVALVDSPSASINKDWAWFEAKGEDELPALRDAVTQFIIDHKAKEDAELDAFWGTADRPGLEEDLLIAMERGS